MLKATIVTVNSATAYGNGFGNKRISKVELEAELNAINNARIARYYRSPLSEELDETSGVTVNDVNDGIRDVIEVENDHNENVDIRDQLNTESPAVTIEMPLESTESEHLLIGKPQRKHLNSGDLLKSEQKTESFNLPTNYEYPELVHSLKNVYKEMFITSGLYVLNIISAVGIVLVNKFIYSYYKFPHGLVLTLYHFVLTSIGLQILAGLKMFPYKPVSLLKVLPLSISFCSYVVLTNLSLQYNSGTFYQVTSENIYERL